MFDIGFAELVIIGVVGLLVIGPERLPGAIRTGSLWMARIRRGFNDIKREVEQEIHNDAVMQELRKTGEQLKEQTGSLGQDIRNAGQSLSQATGLQDAPKPPDPAIEALAQETDKLAEAPQPDLEEEPQAPAVDKQPDKDAG